MKIKKATGLYKCLKCSYQWKAFLNGQHQICPKCRHLYIKWLNYDLLRLKNFKG